MWGSSETLSGYGSTVENSQVVQRALPELIRQLGAQTLLDAGCGDFNWMRLVDLAEIEYIGVDTVPELIREDQQKYGSERRRFILADITKDRLPSADVVMCRHCLIHLTNKQVLAAIENFCRSGIKYLLATTFPKVTENKDIWPGSFRPINMEIRPFNLPKPLFEIPDSATGDDDAPATLALWKLL